ncbi:MAG: hypothetical protein ACLTMP_04125 [Eggerthella lenta]
MLTYAEMDNVQLAALKELEREYGEIARGLALNMARQARQGAARPQHAAETVTTMEDCGR